MGPSEGVSEGERARRTFPHSRTLSLAHALSPTPTLEEMLAFELFVNGTLMRGLPLHKNLEGADFLEEVSTAPVYRLYSIGDVHPGMFEVEEGGVSVKGELYLVSEEIWHRVEAGEPPGLYRGRVRLADGTEVYGILYPRELAEGNHKDISAYGDWRAYTATTKQGVRQ